INQSNIYINNNNKMEDDSSNGYEHDQFMKTKIGLIFVIFAMTLGASYVPFALGRSGVKNLVVILSFMTCFAAGIILAGAFNHLLPTANELFVAYFEKVHPNNKYGNFPYAPTIAILILFMLIALDKLVVEKGVGGEAGHNHMDLSAQLNESSKLLDNGDITLGSYNGTSTGGGGGADLSRSITGGAFGSGHGHGGQDGADNMHEHESINNGKSHAANVSQAWIFMLALSVHSIFDGLGLGAENDPNNFYGLLVAVLAHKALDGFALGVPVYYAKFSRLQTALALTFCAAMTPLGIAIGMIISHFYTGEGSNLAEGIILSITTGSFLYISLIELLPSGFSQPDWMKVKLSLAFTGWAILAVLALWV
ncbi:hypothetical protein SAMD00019534_052650, partial [Acytostelium subglobosum LB1]|uniref:hypothetical protein n=1 Tax=Acytostelium subglobosum LB1 TaxID=1410327 RepID=UPI000644E2C4